MIPAVIAERTFASRYIADYEKVDRAWISYLVNGSCIVLAFSYYVLLQLVITVLIVLISTLMIIMLYRRDATKLRDLSHATGRSTIHYTLSMKFQLAENVRVTK
ncbi:hypothetical protein OESDEN_18125, partial [Oesophagostomum dentatum]